MHRVSVPREFASRSMASHQGEPEAVLHVDLEGQQAIWRQGCYQAERHIASSTLRAGTGAQDGSFGRWVVGETRTTASRDCRVVHSLSGVMSEQVTQ